MKRDLFFQFCHNENYNKQDRRAVGALSVLYDNKIVFRRQPDYDVFDRYLKLYRSLAMITQTTNLLIDHYKKNVYLYQHNQAYAGIFGRRTGGQVDEEYLDIRISPEDATKFSTIVRAIKDCARSDFLKGDRSYYFSFDITLKISPQQSRLFSFKAIPCLFTEAGDPWVTIYHIEPSLQHTSGNLALHAVKKNALYHFWEEKREYKLRTGVYRLSDGERKILQFSAEGFTEKEIADLLELSVYSLKNLKVRMFKQMSVNSLPEAIALAYRNGLIS
ncbi:MAG: LuxR C-terminal-related transcriptional regulator [Proteiniphilum sp.]|jgi:DNA-binding CsgD family transcriptional regulator|nr:LuxR C-terminal-related transcriptional regulator [Proteiniphilum sp.]